MDDAASNASPVAHTTRSSMSSNESGRNIVNTNPIEFTGENQSINSNTQKQKGRRRTSSFADSVNRVRKTLSANSALSSQSNALSIQEIYGDMDENEVSLRRTATRTTILTSLSQRVSEAEREGRDEESKLYKNNRNETLYENLPDTSVPTKNDGGEFASIDPELVTWDGPDDPNFPRNWPLSRKCYITALVSLYTLVSPMSSSMLSPAMDDIAEYLNVTSAVIQAMIVSIMILAWSVGPLFIAPLSESDKIGRKYVLNVAIWVLFFFNLGCALSRNLAEMLVFRFLGGLAGCAPLSVGAGVLSDVWDNRQRNRALSIYSLGPTLGPVLAPVMSGFIVENCGWRWVFYVLCILNGTVAIVGTFIYEETYSPKLLRDKAVKLRKESGNPNLKTIYEIADGETRWGKIQLTVTRPIKLLFTNPMVLGLGSFMAFTYGFMYLLIVTFPTVWGEVYGFNTGIIGLMYIPMGIGFTGGLFFWTWLMDVIYIRLTKKNGGVAKPEFRLPCLCFSGIGIPVGLIWYGWSAQKQLHWIMPSIGACIFAFSLTSVFQTIQNYLIDMNTRFAASSIAAAAVFRSLFGFTFPLFATKMYGRLHYGWGNTMCAFVGLLLGLPFPLFVLMYGERLREWANRRMEREQAARDAKNLARLQKIQQNETNRLLSSEDDEKHTPSSHSN